MIRYKAMHKKLGERLLSLGDEIGPYEVRESEILSDILDQFGELAQIQANIELRKDEIDELTLLTAVNECGLETNGDQCLTIGRAYCVQSIVADDEDGKCVVVVNDFGDEHQFIIQELEDYFDWTLLKPKY